MSKMEFKQATRKQLKPKVGLMGTAGTGKTWLSLCIAEALGGSIAVIDSERGRAEAYAGDFTFDHLKLADYSPETYIEALVLANDGDYDQIIVDSISHEWMGKGGILSSVDRFGGWKEATPRHDEFVEALFALPRNVICTIRAKTQYQVSEIEVNGRKKQEITKLGVGPVQRDNLEYEFDLLGMLELDHSLRLHKSVISTLPSGSILPAGDNARELGRTIAWSVKEWMEMGEEVPRPEDASADDIAWLVTLLREEGFDAEMIASRFKRRSLELGALTPEYVGEQSKLSAERLKAKGRDVEALRAKFDGAEPVVDTPEKAQASTNDAAAADTSPDADTGAEGEPGPQTGTAGKDAALATTTDKKDDQ